MTKNYLSQLIQTRGEISFNFNGLGHHVQNVVLLYQDNGLPVSVVNNWLIYLKTSLYRKSVNTQAQALLHYFIFLDEIGLEWGRDAHYFKK